MLQKPARELQLRSLYGKDIRPQHVNCEQLLDALLERKFYMTGVNTRTKENRTPAVPGKYPPKPYRKTFFYFTKNPMGAPVFTDYRSLKNLVMGRTWEYKVETPEIEDGTLHLKFEWPRRSHAQVPGLVLLD
jgi:hypothetical protein